MKSKIQTLVIVLVSGLFLFAANYAQADLVKCGGPAPEAPCTIPDLIKTVVAIINFLLSWAWLVSTLFIVWSGWNMLDTGGNEENIATAKTSFKQAVIGFFLIMASFVLINFIVSILFGSGQPRVGTFEEIFGKLRLTP